MDSKKRIARMAGFLYLALAIIGPFGLIIVPSELIVDGDATATANNIMDSENLYRLGLISEAIIFLIEIVLVALLYILLKSVNATLSLAAALARLSMAVIQGVNVLVGFAVLLLLGGASYLTVFEPNQLNALALLSLDLRNAGVFVWEVFFGLHLLILGYLFVKSGYIPQILGGLIVIASFGYFIHGFGNFLFFDYEVRFGTVTMILSAIPEVLLTLWLLIRGVNTQQETQHASLNA